MLLSGDTLTDYFIEYSQDLKQWQALTPHPMTIWDGPIFDETAASEPNRFYRVVEIE